MRPRHHAALIFLALSASGAVAAAGTLTVRTPADARPSSAVAAAPREKSAEVAGKVGADAVTFDGLDSGRTYDVRVTCADGTELQGVDLAWYSDEPAPPDAGPLTDDDREEIRAIVQDVPAFENRRDILILRGGHDRAVAVVQLVRDTAFHSDAGGEATWRVELHYFKFQYGGWERVQQQNKLLRRERFKTKADYERIVGKLKWVPELGGVRVGKDERKQITVAPAATLEKRE